MSSTQRSDVEQIPRAWLSPATPTAGNPTDTSSADLGGAAAMSDDVPDTAANVGLAVVGCVILLVGCFCPMALFRLLAFVDPGTGSGAALRSTLAASGGVAGLLSSRGTTTGAPSSAQLVDDNGHSAGEASAEAETTTRFSTRLARAVPAVGRATGGALSALGGVATHGASLGVDVMGQAGVGHQGYYDTTPQRGRRPVRTRTGPPGHASEAEDSPLDDLHPGGAQDVGVPRTGGSTPLVTGAAADDAVFLA
jgi:hypothetical protein